VQNIDCFYFYFWIGQNELALRKGSMDHAILAIVPADGAFRSDR
jgi:hypothetical protein